MINERRGGVLPRPAAQHCKLARINAHTHAPVGADDPVRPAVCTRKYRRTHANTHNLCRGRCPHRPARRTSDFTICCGKIGRAQRADRGVRPYRTLYVCADSASDFAIAHCRVDVGIDPYGDFARSPFIARFCWCALCGRGRTPPLRQAG